LTKKWKLRPGFPALGILAERILFRNYDDPLPPHLTRARDAFQRRICRKEALTDHAGNRRTTPERLGGNPRAQAGPRAWTTVSAACRRSADHISGASVRRTAAAIAPLSGYARQPALDGLRGAAPERIPEDRARSQTLL
jgi:hypothetical protein